MTEISEHGQTYLRMLKAARAAEVRALREGTKADRVAADLSELIDGLFAEWLVRALDSTMGNMPQEERNEVVSATVSALLNNMGWMILNAGAAIENDKFARATMVGGMMAHLQMAVANGLTDYTLLVDAARKGMQ